MANDMMGLRSLVEKSADADLLREMIGFPAEKLMALEVGTKTARAMARRMVSDLPQRNGYRDRTQGSYSSYFPSFLELRRMAKKALTAVIQEATSKVSQPDPSMILSRPWA